MFDVFLDRFEEVEPLAGAPEAGEVYRAFDPERGQPVLLRVLPAGPYEIPAVDHPCVRRVLDTFEEAGRRVLVEEWVEGETLDRWIERAETVPVEERLRWLICVAWALVAAHKAGVVHGAVSPAWVTVARGGEPKVAGLGVGTLQGREDATPDDDAFAFGLLAYELMTGRSPFPGRSAPEVREQIEAGAPFPSVLELAADVPPKIDTAVSLCLAGEVDRTLGLFAFLRLDRHGWFVGVPLPTGGTESSLSPGKSLSDTTPLYDENVQFTVYRPRSVPSEHWSRLLFFAHLDALPGDAAEGEADPLEQVEETARRLLGDQARAYQESVQDSRAAVPREGEITVVPEIDGVRFNPPAVTFLWLESVHWHEFRLRPERRLAGTVARGRVVVRHGAILLADIPLRLAVDRPDAVASPDPVPSERETARAYRSIFPSYSHRDTEIVEQFERYGMAIGDAYLRDVTTLRSGEEWNPRLIELIGEADVFQLFWSTHALRSPYVEQEWRHALGLGRPHFVRPVYWQRPLPKDETKGLPPEELRALHFHFLGEPVEGSRHDDDIENADSGGHDTGEGLQGAGDLPPPSAFPGDDERKPDTPPRTIPLEPPDGDFTFSSGRSRGRGWVAAAGVVLMVGLAFMAYYQVAGSRGGSIDLGSEGGAARVATVPVSARGGEESLDLNADQIREIQAILVSSPEVEIVIQGHTAEAGRSDEANLALGEVRAMAVRDRLIELGVPPERVLTISYGEERPVCTEDTEACRERNDRVEILAHAPEPDGAAGEVHRDRPNG